MAGENRAAARSRCLECGFEAPAEDDEWEHVAVPPLGTLAQCPRCASTNVLWRR